MIPVKPVQDLTLEEPAEGSRHISAASGLVRLGDVLYVVADDSRHLGVFPAEARRGGHAVRILEGRRAADPEERSRRKRDLESLVALPPFESFEHGALLALGSGSGEGRDRASLLPLDSRHGVAGDFRPLDLGLLYDSLRGRIGDINIEGATIAGGGLQLFHRGDNSGSDNFRIALDLEAVGSSIAREESPDEGCVQDVVRYDLGQLMGIKLCFSDASTLEDGRVVFAASAEESRAGLEGKYVGSALGALDQELELLWCEPVDAPAKLEGLTARIVGDEVEILMVSDADDDDVASPLFEARLELSAVGGI